MPKYRVLEKSVIGNTIFEEGAEVEYDGLPSFNLEPLDDAGRAKAAEAAIASRTSMEQLIKDYQPATGMNPDAFAAAIANAMKDILAANESKKSRATPKAEVAESLV